MTNAIYDAGFNSNGRFYSESAKRLGMTPSNFRVGGKGELIHFAVGEGACPISLNDGPESLVRDLQIAFPERS